MDGFNNYGALSSLGGTLTLQEVISNLLSGPWANVTVTTNMTVGVPPWGSRTNAYALECPDQSGSIPYGAVRRILPAPSGNVLFSFGFSVPQLPTSDSAWRHGIIAINDSTNSQAAALVLLNTGAIALVTNNGGTVLGTTQGPVIVTENWHALEMQFDLTDGTFTLRVDDATGSGTPALALTGLTFKNLSSATVTSISSFGLWSIDNNQITAWYSDLIVRDTAGSSNNGFMGDYRVQTLPPAADAADQGWTAFPRFKIGTGILDNTASNAAGTTSFNSGVRLNVSPNTASNLGSADFTLETFVRFNTLPSGATKYVIMGKWDEGNNFRSYELYLGGPSLENGNLVFRYSTDGTAATVVEPISYPYAFQTDTWYHVAIVRASGEDLLFVNGVQQGLPIADVATYYVGNGYYALGIETNSGNAVNATALDGWFDEARVTAGFARYTSNFTPTTVPFPTTIGGDPEFADVAFLTSFDSGVLDESSHAWALTAMNGAARFAVDDGAFNYQVIDQLAPRDDTFIQASLIAAQGVYTQTTQPAANDTVTVGTKTISSVTSAAVYKFVVTPASAFDVKIGTSTAVTLANLIAAINLSAGAGTIYGTGTVVNNDVTAVALPGTQIEATASVQGTAGNSIASTAVSAGSNGAWGATTLTGGAAIPGNSEFSFARLGPHTTTIAAIALVGRGYKTDSGLGTMQLSIVGAQGGVVDGAANPLTLSPTFRQDIFETDPDTSGAITPSTIAGLLAKVNRTA